MKNITLSFDEALLANARKYAASNGVSLNSLIRQLVSQVIGEGRKPHIEELFEIADKLKPRSSGKSWKRDDIYDV